MEPEARFNILRLKQEMLRLADEIVQGGNAMNVDRYLVTREELEGLSYTLQYDYFSGASRTGFKSRCDYRRAPRPQ